MNLPKGRERALPSTYERNVIKLAKDKKEEVDFKTMYGKPATMTVDELIKEQKINIEKGLSTKQVNERINNYGYNEISKKKEKNGIIIFLEVYSVNLI